MKVPLVRSDLPPKSKDSMVFFFGLLLSPSRARFSRVQKSFCTRKAIAKTQSFRLQICFIYILQFNMNRGCLHARRFRRVNLSAFRRRQWLCRPPMFLGLSKTKPKCSRLPSNNKCRKTQWTKQKTGESC